MTFRKQLTSQISNLNQTKRAERYICIDPILSLQILTQKNFESLFHLVIKNKSYLGQWLAWAKEAYTLEDSIKFINEKRELFKQKKEFTYGMFSEKTLVGCICAHNLDWSQGTAYLGYWIAKEYSNQGITSKCCKGLMEYLFSREGIIKISICCEPDNYASQRIAEKLRMSKNLDVKSGDFYYYSAPK